MTSPIRRTFFAIGVATTLLLASCGGSSTETADDAAASTTSAPTTTAAPTTAVPTTAVPTTAVPTTAAPTTEAPTTTAAPTTTEAPATTEPNPNAAINEGLFVGTIAADLERLDQGWSDDQLLAFGYTACDSVTNSGTDLIDAIGATTAAVAADSTLPATGASAWLAAQTVVIAAGSTICDSEVKANIDGGIDTLSSYELEQVRYLIALHATEYPFFIAPTDEDLLLAGEAACAELEASTDEEITEGLLAAVEIADLETFFTTVAAGSVDSLCPQYATPILAALNQL